MLEATGRSQNEFPGLPRTVDLSSAVPAHHLSVRNTSAKTVSVPSVDGTTPAHVWKLMQSDVCFAKMQLFNTFWVMYGTLNQNPLQDSVPCSCWPNGWEALWALKTIPFMDNQWGKHIWAKNTSILLNPVTWVVIIEGAAFDLNLYLWKRNSAPALIPEAMNTTSGAFAISHSISTSFLGCPGRFLSSCSWPGLESCAIGAKCLGRLKLSKSR